MLKKNNKETVVIDLGGSIVFPDFFKINRIFLSKLKIFLEKEIKNKNFIIVIGGGKFCRFYQNEAKKMGVTNNTDLDWIGIRITQLNAELLKSYFGKLAFPEIITTEHQKINWDKGVLLSSGWHPGNSTDLISFKLAAIHQAEKIIIATNIDYIYEEDININKNAKKIEKMDWQGYSSLIKTKKWEAGMSIPIDPAASKLGKKESLNVFLVNGNNFSNLKKAILGEKFKGTVISNNS